MCICIDFFFFNDTATTEIYTLSLHDALPISSPRQRIDRLSRAQRAGSPDQFRRESAGDARGRARPCHDAATHLDRSRRVGQDRKSTRLNSSHANISYAVFCLKKKKTSLQTST